MDLTIAYTILAFAAGMWLGGWMRDRAWQENADHPMRIFRGGKFYKVLYDPPTQDQKLWAGFGDNQP